METKKVTMERGPHTVTMYVRTVPGGYEVVAEAQQIETETKEAKSVVNTRTFSSEVDAAREFDKRAMRFAGCGTTWHTLARDYPIRSERVRGMINILGFVWEKGE